jgi:superfamily II DNA/RNA helicase
MDLLERIKVHVRSRDVAADDEEVEDDVIPEEIKQRIEKLDEKEYSTTDMVLETLLDLDQLADFLDELKESQPANDDKLQQLIALLQTDPVLSKHKVLIFTEFQDTARYLQEQLTAEWAGKSGSIDKVDSTDTRNRGDIIRAFAPYYNDSSSDELAVDGFPETRILISTDVLSEGLNLQDATCIINYDLHWNPVRLMQRIGRVDRRLDTKVEERILTKHPETSEIRGHVWLYNFLPPDELNQILSLYQRVTHKTLRISKILGIEGQKLLTPTDEYQALKEFNQAYEGTTTPEEEMHLRYQQLLKEHPGLADQIEAMPLRVFSGKANIEAGAQGVFFCYRLPGKTAEGEWIDEAGFTRWYYYNLATGEIFDNAPEIHPLIESAPETERQTIIDHDILRQARQQLDTHIKNSYLKDVQAPVGVRPVLLTWMELS